MQTVFKGDLARASDPRIGPNVLAFLLEEGRRSNSITYRSLIVTANGKRIFASGIFDPIKDILTVEGYLN